MPKTPDPWFDLAPAAKRVAKARSELAKAQAELHKAIVAARNKGYTLHSIADKVGLSHARIFQILKGD